MSQLRRGEFEIIDRIKGRCATSPAVRLGIGDDCAMLQLPPGEMLLTTTDMLVEDVHFRRAWTGMESLGKKSAAVNLSDLAAMGAVPKALFLALAVPEDLSAQEIDRFFDGFLEVCHASGAVLAGGDTCASMGGLSISVTALGSASEKNVLRRSGARSGDSIYVTGCLGDSGLALQCLLAGRQVPPGALGRHLEPAARVSIGQALAEAGIATAMIDISDGLLADLGHILAASSVGGLVNIDTLPLSAEMQSAVAADRAVFEQALIGGEDYELLFTAASGSEQDIVQIAGLCQLPITRIGVIDGSPGAIELRDKGQPSPLPRNRGYKHFSDGA